MKDLTKVERLEIAILLKKEYSLRAIATVLGRSPNTVSYEVRVNSVAGVYDPHKADTKAKVRKKGRRFQYSKIEKYPTLKELIIEKLELHWNPREIALWVHRCQTEWTVSTATIYTWLRTSRGDRYCDLLYSERHYKKKHKIKQSRLGKRQLIPNRISIKQRPNDVWQIHAESDLFVSPTKLHTKRVGHLTVIPKTLLLTGLFLPNKSPKTMCDSMHTLEEKLPMTTWTLDNGIENVYHEQFKIPAYFCTPGSPWQKPHVENSIGLLRRWFIPKGTNLETVPEDTFQSMLHVFNHKYRKSLGYESAYEKSLEDDIIKRIPRLSKDSAVAFR